MRSLYYVSFLLLALVFAQIPESMLPADHKEQALKAAEAKKAKEQAKMEGTLPFKYWFDRAEYKTYRRQMNQYFKPLQTAEAFF